MPIVSPIQLNVSRSVSLPGLVLPKLLEYADNLALVDEATGREISFREFVVNVKRLGAALLKQGLRPQQVVSICAPNCIEHIVLFYALSRIGVIYHGISSTSTEDDLMYQISHSDTAILVTDQTIASKMITVISKCTNVKKIFLVGESPTEYMSTLQSLLTNDECDDISDLNPNFDARQTPCTLLYTSGTTGIPKGVLQSQYFYTYILHQIGHEQCVVTQPGDVTVSQLPFFHGLALVAVTHHLYLSIKQVIIPNEWEFAKYVTTIQNCEATVLWTSPSSVMNLSTIDITSGCNPSSVRDIVYAGASVNKPVVDRLMEELPGIRRCYQFLGMSEVGFISMPPYPKDRPDSCGTISPGAERKILDLHTGLEVGPYMKGELYVRAPTLMMRYWKDSEKTSKAIDAQGWLRTGDVAYHDDNGFLYVVNRIKDVINYRTQHVYPSDMDNILLSHPDVKGTATIGVELPVSGEIPCCFLVVRGNISHSEIRRLLSENMDSQLVDDVMVKFVMEIPRNATGKLMLKQLQQWTNNID